MQWDPYDQFASGYVGMGNDPANGVDPSGGKVLPYRNWAALAQKAGSGYSEASAILLATTQILSTVSKASDAINQTSLAESKGNSSTSVDQNKGGKREADIREGSVIPVKDKDGTLLGNLTVGSYHSYTESSGGKGVYISIQYKKVTNKYTRNRYVQTVRTNKHGSNPIDGTIYTFIDPFENGDSEPFYWDIPFEENTENELCNCDASFWDRPRRVANKEHSISWEAELSLVGGDPVSGKYVPLITLNYGFNISKDGKVTARQMRKVSPSAFQLQNISKASLGIIERVWGFIMSFF